jgi:predicted nucleic acid-binding protein
MEEWVFVDTCIWGPFFTKRGSREKAAIDDLLDSDRVALIGPILAEVLSGFRRKDQADWVASRLRMAHYVEANWNDWRDAADLGRDLAGKGNKLPLTDLLVAAVAKRCHAWIYSSDPHFDVIPELKRFRPNGSSPEA